MIDFKYALMEKWEKFDDHTMLSDDTLATLNARRMSMAKGIFAKIGTNVFIEPGLSTNWGCNTFIGNKVYINRG